jgi:hypothetical protein
MLAVQGRRKSVSPLAAAKDPTDTLSGEVQAGTSKRGQHHGVYRKVILEVEMFGFELEEVLHAKRATICVSVSLQSIAAGGQCWRNLSSHPKALMGLGPGLFNALY